MYLISLRTKYSIELNATFKMMDIRGLTSPSSDISSKVWYTNKIQFYFWVELMGKHTVVSKKYHFMVIQWNASASSTQAFW